MFEVLEIGANVLPIAKGIYTEESVGEEVRITYLDADPNLDGVDVVHELSYPDSPLPFTAGKFDAIMASHILEHIPYFNELQAVKDWARCLKVGGTLNVIVPSWEFVARQVLSEESNMYIKPYAFGGLTSPWDVHVNMFTMNMLRSIFVAAGLSVVRARTGSRTIQSFDNPEYLVEQHYIAGVKNG